VECGILEYVRAYHFPEVPTFRDSFECIKLARIIFIIIFTKRNFTSLHLCAFFVEPTYDVVLGGRSQLGHFKNVYVVDVVDTLVILEGKTEIGVDPLFQIYDPPSLLFELANCTAKRVENLSTAAPARDKCPFLVPSIMNE
jgi:hypothetical protein